MVFENGRSERAKRSRIVLADSREQRYMTSSRPPHTPRFSSQLRLLLKTRRSNRGVSTPDICLQHTERLRYIRVESWKPSFVCICMYVCMYAFRYVSTRMYQSINFYTVSIHYLPTYLSIFPSIYLFIYLLAYLFTYLHI